MNRLAELFCLGLAIIIGLPGAILMATGFLVVMIANGCLTLADKVQKRS
jgi:hypothetical protein